MLFFKPKQKADEILPPPPPFPGIENEEPIAQLAELKLETPEDKADDFFAELSNTLKKEIPSKKEKLTQKKAKKAVIKPKEKKLKKGEVKKLKTKTQEKKVKAKIEKKIEPKVPSEFEDFGLNLDLNLETLEKPSEKEIELNTKKELLEAEEEIKSAIEKVKKIEKPTLFNRLFAKKKIEAKPEIIAPKMPKLAETDKISKIQNKISSTRQAIMNLDLKVAKKEYIEIMGIYNSLKPEDKAKIYQEIRDLYSERKSAEELKVK